MKYLLVTPDFPPATGGVARYLGVLGEEKDRLLVASPHGPIKLQTSSWIPLLWRVRQMLTETKSDALIISHVLPFGYAALFCGRPYVVICHGLDASGPLKNLWKKFWVKVILQRATRIIANSEATKRLLSAYDVSEEKINVVYPPCSFDPASTGMMFETQVAQVQMFSNKKMALIVNRLVPRKGIDVALRALKICLRICGDVVLVIAGTGPEEKKLKMMAEDLEISQSVFFLGNVSDAMVRDLYRAATVVLYPSINIPGDAEGYGIGAADAAVFGKPVIASDTGGLSEAVFENESGLLVSPGDVDALAKSICTILTDEALATRLQDTARQLALQRTHATFREEFFLALS